MTLDPVRRLLAIEEIKQLKARYFRLLDSEDWEAFRAVFTDDARFSFPGGRYDDADPDEFVVRLRENYGRKAASSVHHGHTPEIEITGDGTARGIWAMFDYVDRHENGGRRAFQGYGHYHEEYRREGGEWKIASVRLTRARVDAVPPDFGMPPPPVR
jgi:ketosteroid isomerase-like protein